MLGVPQAVLLGSTALAAVTYDALVATFGADVVSYWKFQNDGVDQRGIEDAAISGTPELNVESIVGLDTLVDGAPANGECLAWPGAAGVFAEAAHNAAHKTPAGTIVVTFQHDSLTQKSTLIAADANAVAGGLSLEVQTNGVPRAFLRRQSDGGFVALAGEPGDVQLNEAYTLIFKWGPGGLSLALWDQHGVLVRRKTDTMSDGVTGSSPIRFGAWHNGESRHDGPYGRVIWLQRRISNAEEGVLAVSRTISRGSLLTRLGAWPLAETSGGTFADAVGSNAATLTVPTWTIATHEHNRPGIVAGSDHALEVSNGGPAIPMIAAYRQAAMSLTIYVEPLGELRGTQYWDESHEEFGREFIAHCDDGATPGSFALYRRRTAWNSSDWRLGGYIRNGAGVKQYFGGGLAGVSGAGLPTDTARRVVLTQGPGGAALYLDGSLVASLPSVTQGWIALTHPIQLGCSSYTGHANLRSPLWGRLDQIEVWQGQMTLTDVAGRPGAAQSLRYRIPTDGPLLNIALFGGNLQAAMDAADAAGGYVYQDGADATWYSTPASSAIGFRPNCRGMVGVRMRRTAGDPTAGARMVALSTKTAYGGALTSAHADRYAGSGGYKFIGCRFDGNARNQNWSATGAGTTFRGFEIGTSLQFAHCIQVESSSGPVTMLVDSCEMYDNIGDGISASERSRSTIKSTRFYGCFRGPFICNDLVAIDMTALRCESFQDAVSKVGGRDDNGCGMCDIEPFQPSESNRILWHAYDFWAEGDLDDRNYEVGSGQSQSHYCNVHTTRPGLALQPHRDGSGRNPTSSIILQRCTISFYRRGIASSPDGGGSWPKEMFEECVFLANGRPLCFHEFGLHDPVAEDGAPAAKIIYETAGVADTRLMTLRNCQFRVTRLPSGIALGNTRCIDFPSLSTTQNIELDGVRIDAAFADQPFTLGGMTMRHRGVLHERTGSTKPWSGAGAEVAL
jgi:hypothetical protein